MKGAILLTTSQSTSRICVCVWCACVLVCTIVWRPEVHVTCLSQSGSGDKNSNLLLSLWNFEDKSFESESSLFSCVTSLCLFSYLPEVEEYDGACFVETQQRLIGLICNSVET